MSSESNERKRTQRCVLSEDVNGWDCSVCTFKNSPEAFKCVMCDTRKGTSTRKPRVNQQQAIIHQVSLQQTKKEKKLSQRFRRPARLKNIDRSSAKHMVVSVGEVTVIITDYKPKPERSQTPVDDVYDETTSSESSDTESSSSASRC